MSGYEYWMSTLITACQAQQSNLVFIETDLKNESGEILNLKEKRT